MSAVPKVCVWAIMECRLGHMARSVLFALVFSVFDAHITNTIVSLLIIPEQSWAIIFWFVVCLVRKTNPADLSILRQVDLDHLRGWSHRPKQVLISLSFEIKIIYHGHEIKIIYHGQISDGRIEITIGDFKAGHQPLDAHVANVLNPRSHFRTHVEQQRDKYLPRNEYRSLLSTFIFFNRFSANKSNN